MDRCLELHSAAGDDFTVGISLGENLKYPDIPRLMHWGIDNRMAMIKDATISAVKTPN